MNIKNKSEVPDVLIAIITAAITSLEADSGKRIIVKSIKRNHGRIDLWSDSSKPRERKI